MFYTTKNVNGTFCPNTFCLCAVRFVQVLFVLQLCYTLKQEESARERALCQLTECF